MALLAALASHKRTHEEEPRDQLDGGGEADDASAQPRTFARGRPSRAEERQRERRAHLSPIQVVRERVRQAGSEYVGARFARASRRSEEERRRDDERITQAAGEQFVMPHKGSTAVARQPLRHLAHPCIGITHGRYLAVRQERDIAHVLLPHHA